MLGERDLASRNGARAQLGYVADSVVLALATHIERLVVDGLPRGANSTSRKASQTSLTWCRRS